MLILLLFCVTGKTLFCTIEINVNSLSEAPMPSQTAKQALTILYMVVNMQVGIDS
jgi:hypothetical protein